MGPNGDTLHDWYARYSQLSRDAESPAMAEGRMYRDVWPGSIWTDDERADQLTIVLDEHGEFARMFPG